MQILVTGGWFDGSGACWIERVWPGGRERLATFEPPTVHRVPGKGFTGAAWCHGELLVCGFDAVWRFDREWRCIGRLHQPDFNDLHGVAVDEPAGLIYVANTGLDAVEIIGLDGRFRGRIALTPSWFEARRQRGEAVDRDELPRVLATGWEPVDEPRWTQPSRDAYYDSDRAAPFHRRKVRDYLHPNHIAVAPDGEPIVTLLATRELRSLRTLAPIATLDGHPHDGAFVGSDQWVTTTDGRVWSISRDGEVRMVVDAAGTGHVGWCRGLAVGDDWVAVGLTEVVSEPQYHWRDDPLSRSESAILWFRRVGGALIGRVDLTDRERHTKVFGLLPWSAR